MEAKATSPRLVGISRHSNNNNIVLENRHIPLDLNDIKLVMQLTDNCYTCDLTAKPKVPKDDFVRDYESFTLAELKHTLTATKDEITSLLSQSIPCVGCRKSVENLFVSLKSPGHSRVLEPLCLTANSSGITIRDQYLQKCHAVYRLLHVLGPSVSLVVEALGKQKKKTRCGVHCLDMHKHKFVNHWKEVWDNMDQEVREAVLVFDTRALMSTVDTYLSKHKFCSECRGQVFLAYSLLVQEKPPSTTQGYNSTLYKGIRYCAEQKHVHVPHGDSDYLEKLLIRAVPDLLEMRRERHAKTLEVAQEEVMTCVGIFLFDRLHRLWVKMRSEFQTWNILFGLCSCQLLQNFKAAVEKKKGLGDIDEICRELEGTSDSICTCPASSTETNGRRIVCTCNGATKRRKKKSKGNKSTHVNGRSDLVDGTSSNYAEGDSSRLERQKNEIKSNKSDQYNNKPTGKQYSIDCFNSHERTPLQEETNTDPNCHCYNLDCASLPVCGKTCESIQVESSLEVLKTVISPPKQNAVTIERCDCCSSNSAQSTFDNDQCVPTSCDDPTAATVTSLEDLLKSDETADDCISEEEIARFQANKCAVENARQALREKLRKNFDTLTKANQPEVSDADTGGKKRF